MSGRRLRHVNAEKRLEDWKAEEEGRKLEKIAQGFLNKNAKKGKKGVGDGEANKYVDKYRQDSAKCVAKVEESVREAMINAQKRKLSMANEAEAKKKIKIWKGKRIVGEADDMDEDSSDDDEEEENEKSIVLDSGNHPDPDKEREGSSVSVTGAKHDGELSAGASCESGSEEEKEIVLQNSLHSGGSSGGPDVLAEKSGVIKPAIDEEKIAQSGTAHCAVAAVISGTEPIQSEAPCLCPSTSGNEVSLEIALIQSEANCSTKAVNGIPNIVELEQTLDFDEFNSAVEIEVLGMERLKSELQARGLKCGGTLQECAARLFLLKSTPLDKLSKKLLAKK